MSFIFDKFLGSIRFISEEELKNNSIRYKKIKNHKKINMLERKNYNIINKAILSNGNNKYYHLSTKPLEKLIDTSKEGTTYVGNTNLYYHPIGLYVSCGNKYFEEKSIHYTYVYELILNNTVLKINNLSEFIDFINTFKYSDSTIKIYNVLNWKKIKNIYDGIIICSNLTNKIFGDTKSLLDIYEDETIIQNKINELYGNQWKKKLVLLSEWYRHWRSEGVIWRPSAVKDIKLIIKTDTFDCLNK